MVKSWCYGWITCIILLSLDMSQTHLYLKDNQPSYLGQSILLEKLVEGAIHGANWTTGSWHNKWRNDTNLCAEGLSHNSKY